MKVELFVKSSAQLTAFLSLLASRDPGQSLFTHFNVPNKLRNENLFPYAAQLLEAIPHADVCLHYSLKNNRFRSLEESTSHFAEYSSKARALGVKEVLLVSGSGDKRQVNSVTCLQNLRRRGFITEGLAIGVAFNPYLFSEAEVDMERQRLREKLETGLVSVVYLQFGTELQLLEESLRHLQSLQPSWPNVKIYGSVFLPSKQLIARMKFRPWKGLYLSPEFLNSVEEATHLVQEILEIYRKYDVEFIIETAFRTSGEADHMEKLLGVRRGVEESS